jgi:hypothetical protein
MSSVHQVPSGGLEPCPHCGRRVSFTSNICPSCLIDRVNPDPDAVVKWKAAREQAGLADSQVPKPSPILISLALGCYLLGFFVLLGFKPKGHDAGLAFLGAMFLGPVMVLLGTCFAIIAAARQGRSGYLTAVVLAIPLGILVVLVIVSLL